MADRRRSKWTRFVVIVLAGFAVIWTACTLCASRLLSEYPVYEEITAARDVSGSLGLVSLFALLSGLSVNEELREWLWIWRDRRNYDHRAAKEALEYNTHRNSMLAAAAFIGALALLFLLAFVVLTVKGLVTT